MQGKNEEEKYDALLRKENENRVGKKEKGLKRYEGVKAERGSSQGFLVKNCQRRKDIKKRDVQWKE